MEPYREIGRVFLCFEFTWAQPKVYWNSGLYYSSTLSPDEPEKHQKKTLFWNKIIFVEYYFICIFDF